MPPNKECCRKLPLTLLKSVRGKGLKHSEWWWPHGDCFYNYRNILFNSKPILRFGATPLVFVVVVLITLATLFAMFPAQRQKWLCFRTKTFTIF